MAQVTFEAYFGAGPSWQSLGSNRLVFCGSLTDIAVMIQTQQFQDGNHVGSGTPGSDQCATNHVPNVKWLTDTTMSVNGGASETINDTNLADTECSLRVHFNDSVARKIQNGRLYSYNNSVTTSPAEGVDMAAYEKANSSQWHHLNDYSTTGPTGWTTGGIGGDNAGGAGPPPYGRISMGARASAATDQYWYYALSVSPETAGGKANFALGCYMEYYS